MKASKSIVVFLLEGYRYGMPLEIVERVAPVVEITPIPDAPDTVIGIINVRGKIMPVLNLRQKLKLTERPLRLSDQLLICHPIDRSMALLVDSIEGAMEYAEDDVAVTDGDTRGEHVLKTPEGIIYIYAYERLLSSTEQIVLNRAMEQISA